MPLSVKDIEYFLAVVRRGALSGAAEEMGVTQPAVTKAIQRVEAEFGVMLFERSGRGVNLTSAGLRAAEQLKRLNAAHADTQILANEMMAIGDILDSAIPQSQTELSNERCDCLDSVAGAVEQWHYDTEH